MAQPVIQTSFHAGEWAPALNARVDLAKYKSAAALLKNFFVDYRGGASSRTGTKYLATAKISNKAVRLIPFQASVDVGYVLEFGDFYIRFFANGAQVLSGGLPYEIASPYAASDLANLKFAQNISSMVLTHPSYPVQILTLLSATNWIINPAVFGSSTVPPTGVSVTTSLAAGTTNYSYIVSSVDATGQESAPTAPAVIANIQDMTTVAGSNFITWTVSVSASSYNIYKATRAFGAAVPAGSPHGFIGNCEGNTFTDTNIAADFSQGPTVPQNPFFGAGVASLTLTGGGSGYTSLPSVLIELPEAGGVVATGVCAINVLTVAISSGGGGYVVGEVVALGYDVRLVVASVSFGAITGLEAFGYPETSRGVISAGPVPANPVPQGSSSGAGTGATFDLTWQVGSITLISAGSGYTSAPTVSFTGGGGATATSTLGTAASFANPSTVTFFQQRLVLAAPNTAVQTFYMSQPGSFFNFDITNPIQPDDAITGSIVAGQLNYIQSMISVPSGLILLSNKAAWQITGGSRGSAVTPVDIVANAHSYNGASGVPPIVANFDILYVQEKGSVVRDLTYNFYADIFTGTDISVLSSHLFYGRTLTEWAWAEEPFKLVHAVRDDGIMLMLTFLKEQDLIGWTHSDTPGGLFRSVATVTERSFTGVGKVDATYVVVDRTVNGVLVKYIERFSERLYPNGASDAWCVDAGIQYRGVPATSFSGAAHLSGLTVSGLADGNIITPFVMNGAGTFTLPSAASVVTVGLQYYPQLQTLQIELPGEQTIQGRMKAIPEVTLRVQDTLGLQIGSTFNNLVPIKDLQLGNVGSASNAVVTNLVTGDAKQIIDTSYTVPGQYCIQQNYPWPVTILGVIPQITGGMTK